MLSQGSTDSDFDGKIRVNFTNKLSRFGLEVVSFMRLVLAFERIESFARDVDWSLPPVKKGRIFQRKLN